MLGEAGATVYCTGRSSRGQPNLSGHVHAGRPETIEETAEMVTAAGGVGIPARVDHTGVQRFSTVTYTEVDSRSCSESGPPWLKSAILTPL